jgi:hypothetical protein
MSDDTYFLSTDNPIANIDQRDLEGRALELMARPELQRARNAVAHLWREAVAYPCRDQMPDFEDMITELVFWHALFAANGDAGHPRVLRVMEPPARSFGRDLPGSRWGGDCPDFIYRMVPIEHGGRYQVRVAATCNDPPLTNYTLMGASMSPPANISVLDSRDTQSEAGEILLTIDDTAAEGRKNHIQTRPGAHHLLVRDAVTAWLDQTPSKLRVQRLDTPAHPPRTDEDLAAEAVRRTMETCFFAYYTTRSANGHPPNIFSTPASSGAAGGMPTQLTCKGAVDLADDEALIVTVNAAGALYRNVQLNDAFFRSVNYWDRTGAFNMTQMAADDDGLFTFVIAHEDPGVHNWLDTGGRNQTLFGHRWQHFATGGAREAPSVSTRVVKFRELEAALPDTVKAISAEDRRRQLAERSAGFRRRLAGRQ